MSRRVSGTIVLCPWETHHERHEESGGAAVLATALWVVAFGQGPTDSPIHFSYRPDRLSPGELRDRTAPRSRDDGRRRGGLRLQQRRLPGHLLCQRSRHPNLKKTSAKYSNRLFQNDGKGNFKDVTERAGLAGAGYDNGVAIGDYDNDGFEDIFVGGVHRNRLYHNNGNGTFTDVTGKAGICQQAGPASSAPYGRSAARGWMSTTTAGWTCSW